MTYSCALFEEGTETLEQAQDAKLELICAKLGLQPGQRVLDIGCGWGSFAIHAACEHGVGSRVVNSSPPQAELARERVRDAGLEDRVEIRSRTTASSARSGSTPSSASGWWSTSARRGWMSTAREIARVLEPDGAVLNHGIVRVAAQEGGAHLGGEFSNRYVFPDGELLNLSRMQAAFERAGLETLHIEDLHTDYAETLRHWITRLDQPRRGRARAAEADAAVVAVPARRAQQLQRRRQRRLPAAVHAAAHRGAVEHTDRGAPRAGLAPGADPGGVAPLSRAPESRPEASR